MATGHLLVGSSYLRHIAYIGDTSIISIPGGCLYHTIEFIKQTDLASFNSIFILVGGNDISIHTEVQKFIEQYLYLIKCVQEKKESIQIKISTILPRITFSSKEEELRKKINIKLKFTLQKIPNVTVYRIDRGFCKNGLILSNLYCNDGVHHNREGILKLKSMLMQAITGRTTGYGDRALVINKRDI